MDELLDNLQVTPEQKFIFMLLERIEKLEENIEVLKNKNQLVKIFKLTFIISHPWHNQTISQYFHTEEALNAFKSEHEKLKFYNRPAHTYQITQVLFYEDKNKYYEVGAEIKILNEETKKYITHATQQ